MTTPTPAPSQSAPPEEFVAHFRPMWKDEWYDSDPEPLTPEEWLVNMWESSVAGGGWRAAQAAAYADAARIAEGFRVGHDRLIGENTKAQDRTAWAIATAIRGRAAERGKNG